MMEKMDTAIANVLRRSREGAKLSQEQLSFKADLHRTYISQLERGLKSVTLKTLLKITIALNIELVDFIKEVQNELKNISSGEK
jgi:transcriptional regulator with XRE-family HTH domain